MDNPSSIPKPGRLTYSCIRCANRKVKCDRRRPCSACVKHSVECVFHASHAPRKKAKRIKVQALTERLNQYENLLRKHGIDASNTIQGDGTNSKESKTDYHEIESPRNHQSPSKDTDHQFVNRMRLVDGQVHIKFVENSLWTKVFEEFDDAEWVSEDSESSVSSAETDGDFDFVLTSRTKSKKKARQPPIEQAQRLWTLFVENVDPLTKIVHVPSLQPAFLRALETPFSIPRNIEALLFAIYSTSIMTLQESECQEEFSESRVVLLSHFISATERALSRANFMATASIVVLQALVLHLTAVRDIYEPRAVWALTGVAVRIAQVMGLERDGSQLGLPVFETEMRRRIWWQLKLHDFRAAELCGLAKFRDIDFSNESTSWPTSLNDDELFPGMPTPLEATGRITDSVFFDLRCELTRFAASRVAALRNQGKDSSQWNLDAFKFGGMAMENKIKDLEQTVETKYVRYCDPSQPLHLITMLMARYAMNTVRFLTNHPRSWTDQTPLSEKQKIWKISITLMEQHCMIKTNPLLKRFAWHAAYFQQWHALIHVLDTLRMDPLHPDSENVWRLLASIYNATPAMEVDTKKPIYAAVGNLCLKAYGAREAVGFIQRTPPFIAKLREKQKQARAKREARITKVAQEATRHASQSKAMNPALTSVTNAEVNMPTSQLSSAMPISASASGSFNPMQFSFMGELESFDVSHQSTFDMDLDAILGLDSSNHTSDTAPISWDQWDAWLSESNSIRPQHS